MCKQFINSTYKNFSPFLCCQCQKQVNLENSITLCLNCALFLHKDCLHKHTVCKIFYNPVQSLYYLNIVNGRIKGEISITSELLESELLNKVIKIAKEYIEEICISYLPYKDTNKIGKSPILFIRNDFLYVYRGSSQFYTRKLFNSKRINLGSARYCNGLVIVEKIHGIRWINETIFVTEEFFTSNYIVYKLNPPKYRHLLRMNS